MTKAGPLGLQQIIGTQRVGNMRPLGWKTLVDQLRFQYGERFDHNSEFKRPHIGNPCIKLLILVIRLNGSLK